MRRGSEMSRLSTTNLLLILMFVVWSFFAFVLQDILIELVARLEVIHTTLQGAVK